ncbi:MAG: hypothetical protein MUO40_04835 [Anaerolineaceae bacterium]|nr:hypothetical protein [Anaerolineaceae bacterium]
MAKRDFYTNLVYARKNTLFGKMAYYLLKLLGSEIPRSVPIGENFLLEHGGHGVVIHSKASIGNNVRVYQGVTVGRADIHLSAEDSKFESIQIEDDVILSPGSKVLCKEGVLVVARGTMLGANAVLLESTGENEIWAGIPARCIGKRVPNTRKE